MNPVTNTQRKKMGNKICNGVKIIVRNLQKRIPISPKRIRETVLKTLSLERIDEPGEITILFLKDKETRALNLKYLGCDSATDVITFDLREKKRMRSGEGILVDIAISTDTAVRNARIFKTTPLYEIYLYVIHGVLHVLGYDDKNAKQKKIMEDKSIAILNKLQVTHYI